MKEKKLPFIKTSDPEVIKILTDAGYPELEPEGSIHVFVNIGQYKDGKFSTIPVDNCTFSRRMCL